jgi:hypothetical protein
MKIKKTLIGILAFIFLTVFFLLMGGEVQDPKLEWILLHYIAMFASGFLAIFLIKKAK